MKIEGMQAISGTQWAESARTPLRPPPLTCFRVNSRIPEKFLPDAEVSLL